MSMVDKRKTETMVAPNDAGEPENSSSDRFSGRSRMRCIGSVCWSCFMLCVFMVIGFQFGGLMRYAHFVTTPSAPISNKADGIVVLTGGENRIRTAMRLLSEGKANRLLITGVNPSLSEVNLRHTLNIEDSLFNCCVDIDWSARDTIGNALAAKKWVHQVEIKKLVVVTGAFHMPRALKELGHAIQGVELIASPVNVPTRDNWWRDHSRLRDMLREYAKLMFVSGRDYMNEWTGKPWPTMPMQRFNKNAHLSNENIAPEAKRDVH